MTNKKTTNEKIISKLLIFREVCSAGKSGNLNPEYEFWESNLNDINKLIREIHFEENK